MTNEILTTLLTLVLVYGYPIIIIAMIIAYLGIPMPISGLLLAVGAFTIDGTLNLYTVLAIVFFISIIGDVFGYFVGYHFSNILKKSKKSYFGITSEKTKIVTSYMRRWGSVSIFLTRWLITPLGLPINIVAGINHFPIYVFTLLVFLGEAIWTVMYIFAGRYFGANWSSILEYASNIPVMLTAVVSGIVFVYLGIRLHRNTA